MELVHGPMRVWDGYNLTALRLKKMLRMKRIAALALLVALGGVCGMPADAQRMSNAEYARMSRKAEKKQQKAYRRTTKKQQKAMRKYAKSQTKAARKANHRGM